MLRGMRLVFLTDPHVGVEAGKGWSLQPRFGAPLEELFDRLREMINRFDPQAVAVGGDLTENSTLPEFTRALALVRRAAGARPVLAVAGNHDLMHERALADLAAAATADGQTLLPPTVWRCATGAVVLVNNLWHTPSDPTPRLQWGKGHPIPSVDAETRARVELELAELTREGLPAVLLIHAPGDVLSPGIHAPLPALESAMTAYQLWLDDLAARHDSLRLVLGGHVHFNTVLSRGRADRRAMCKRVSLAAISEMPHDVLLVDLPADAPAYLLTVSLSQLGDRPG